MDELGYHTGSLAMLWFLWHIQN